MLSSSMIRRSYNELFMNLADYTQTLQRSLPLNLVLTSVLSNARSLKKVTCFVCLFYYSTLDRGQLAEIFRVVSTAKSFTSSQWESFCAWPLVFRYCYSSGMSHFAHVINNSLANSFTFPEESKNCTASRQRLLHAKIYDKTRYASTV